MVELSWREDAEAYGLSALQKTFPILCNALLCCEHCTWSLTVEILPQAVQHWAADGEKVFKK